MSRDHRTKLAGTATVAAGLCIGLGPLAIMSAAAVTASGGPTAASGAIAGGASACSAPGFLHCVRYSYIGDDQTFTVPGGVSEIRVLEWGAGGGGAKASGPQYTAGSGGYTVGDVHVWPGEQLTVTVGGGGYASGNGYNQYVYGGGGMGGNGRYTGAAGGGMSAVWHGDYGSSPLLIAGGGGGASPGSAHGTTGQYFAVVGGGAGGGLGGGQDTSIYSGRGGTQLYGGGAGAPPVACLGSGIGGTAPQDGYDFEGGSGGGADPAPAGLGTVSYGGGGGGGGYFGGGGGRCMVDITDFPNGAGGGGSGFIASGIAGAFTLRGSNGTSAGLDHGAPPAPAAINNPLYLPGLSWGGGMSGAANGGNGQVVIEWGRHHPKPKPSPSPTSPMPSPTSPMPSPSPGPPLPVTGFPFAQFGIAGLTLVGAGGAITGGLTWAARRQRRRA
jgi:hypothetical protein